MRKDTSGLALSVLAAILVLLAGSAMLSYADWGSITISGTGAQKMIELENSVIYVKYANSGIKDGKPYHRITEFSLKQGNKILATQLDSRHHPTLPAFYELTAASIKHDGPEYKTAAIVLGNSRKEELTIYKDTPVLLITYVDMGYSMHGLDYKIKGGNYVIHGADSYKADMGWTKTYPTLQDSITEHGSYYRAGWGGGLNGALNYNGSMILGVYDKAAGTGVGCILPMKQVSWLKLITNSGFERYMTTQQNTLKLFAVSSGGAQGLLSLGRQIVDNEAVQSNPKAHDIGPRYGSVQKNSTGFSFNCAGRSRTMPPSGRIAYDLIGRRLSSQLEYQQSGSGVQIFYTRK